MQEIPHCDELFKRFFASWYSEESLKQRSFPATFPDLMTSEGLIGATQAEASCVTPEGQDEVAKRIALMVEATRNDWPNYLDVSGEVSLEWIDAFDKACDREKIAEIIANSDPTDFSNNYLVLCCEFGAALGHVLMAANPHLIWRMDWPYWDSGLLDPRSGTVMPVFHWAIKKMSKYGVEDGFAAKVRACLNLLEQKVAAK